MIWRVVIAGLLTFVGVGLWRHQTVTVQSVDCLETWKRMETLESEAQRKLVDAMLVEAAKLRTWEEPMAAMKRIRLRPLQDALAAAQAARAARLAETAAGAARVVAAADAEVARRRAAVAQEERVTYSRGEALAFLRARGIPLREGL